MFLHTHLYYSQNTWRQLYPLPWLSMCFQGCLQRSPFHSPVQSDILPSTWKQLHTYTDISAAWWRSWRSTPQQDLMHHGGWSIWFLLCDFCLTRWHGRLRQVSNAHETACVRWCNSAWINELLNAVRYRKLNMWPGGGGEEKSNVLHAHMFGTNIPPTSDSAARRPRLKQSIIERFEQPILNYWRQFECKQYLSNFCVKIYISACPSTKRNVSGNGTPFTPACKPSFGFWFVCPSNCWTTVAACCTWFKSLRVKKGLDPWISKPSSAKGHN